MSNLDDGLVRLGLALYRETLSHGVNFYNVESLIFDHLEKRTPPKVFGRLFHREGSQFWGKEEEYAKKLAQYGIAEQFSRPIKVPHFDAQVREHLIRLTPFGRGIYDLAHLQSRADNDVIDGISIEDTLLILREEKLAHSLASEIQELGPEIDKLKLSNFERSTAQSYIDTLVIICRMPDPDAKLFWVVLNRLNQIAGVASLVVALIALKLSQ